MFLQDPRKAVFRVFSQKYKDLVQKTDLNEAVMSGEYNVRKTDKNKYDVFLAA